VSIFNHMAGHNEGEYDYQQRSDTCNKLCSLPGRHQTAKLYAFLKSILLKIMNATRSCRWLMKFALPVCTKSCVIPYSDNLPWKSVPHELLAERTQAHTS